MTDARKPVDSVERLEEELALVRAAQKQYAEFTQEQVDRIFFAAAMAAGLAIVPAVSLATRHVPGMAFDEAFLEGMFGKAQAGSEAGARAARAARQGA